MPKFTIFSLLATPPSFLEFSESEQHILCPNHSKVCLNTTHFFISVMSLSSHSSVPLQSPMLHSSPMFISNKEVLRIYDQQITAKTKAHKILNVANTVEELCSKYNLGKDNVKQTMIRKLDRLLDKRRAQPRKRLSTEEKEKTFCELPAQVKPTPAPADPVPAPPETPETPETPVRRGGGRPLATDLQSCNKRTKMNHIREKAKDVQNFSDSKGIPVGEVLQLVSKVCDKQSPSGVIKSTMTQVPILEATALIYNLGWSMATYQETRLFNMRWGLEYPTRNAVVANRPKYHPPITKFELKSSVELIPLIENTVLGLFEMIDLKIPDEEDESVEYVVEGKFGCDGSGSHNIRHQKIDR